MIFSKFAAELWPLIDVGWEFMHTWHFYNMESAKTGIQSDSLTIIAFLGYLANLSISRDMRFPTMWYVQPVKPPISLRIREV